MHLSKKIKSVETSPVRKLVPYAADTIEKGKKVYHLNIGQLDVKTPRELFDAISTFDEDVLIQTDFQIQLITDGHIWIDALEKRNLILDQELKVIISQVLI